MEDRSKSNKRKLVYDAVRLRIDTGEYSAGQRLPSEQQLMTTLGVSRPTVSKAIGDLAADGWVERRQGVGTFVAPRASGRLGLGVLRPDEDPTETIEPICQELVAQAEAAGYDLQWPDEKDSLNSGGVLPYCDSLIRRKTRGVFLAPFPNRSLNESIAGKLSEARIRVVLIGADYPPYPQRSDHDLVGIDNHRAGYAAAAHLISRGCRRVRFVVGAPTAAIEARARGVRTALIEQGLADESIQDSFDLADIQLVNGWFQTHRPDGVVCGHDIFAGALLHSLAAAGVESPRDVLVCGIDGFRFDSLLRTPLTSVEQPLKEIGRAAVRRMLDRLQNPGEPAREVLLNFKLVERASTAGEKFGARAISLGTIPSWRRGEPPQAGDKTKH